MNDGFISFEDFSKVKLKVGKITEASIPEGSQNLIRLKVNLGETGERQIFTGLSKWYKPKDLKNKKFIFITNLEPRKMMGEESQGMMLCAVEKDGAPIIIPVGKKIKEGTQVR